MKKILPAIFVLFSITLAQAGLKEWLHGTQPSATPGPPDATAAAVSFAPGIPEQKPIKDFMLAFAEALRVHDGTALKSRVSDKFTVDGAPDGSSPVDFLMQAIIKARSNSEIVITSIEPAGDASVATVEFRATDRPAKTKTFRFDSEGKLVGTDFFTLQRHGFF
jgi:hypothetical protein